MIPIYYVKPEFFDYANNLKNTLKNYEVHSEIFLVEETSINKLIRTNPNAYKIIIRNFEVQYNSLCIRKNVGHLDNVLLDQLYDYIDKFLY